MLAILDWLIDREEEKWLVKARMPRMEATMAIGGRWIDGERGQGTRM